MHVPKLTKRERRAARFAVEHIEQLIAEHEDGPPYAVAFVDFGGRPICLRTNRRGTALPLRAELSGLAGAVAGRKVPRGGMAARRLSGETVGGIGVEIPHSTHCTKYAILGCKLFRRKLEELSLGGSYGKA